MNVIINTFCNLHCPYCFASNVIDRYAAHNCMTIDNFEKALSFLKYNGMDEVRLIGGEPTLHPKLKEFIEKTVDFGFTDIMIFTNGLFNKDLANYFKQVSKRINLHFLFNVNEPRLLKEKYQTIINNLYDLSGYAQVTVGINFYSPDQEYEYIVDLAKEFGCNTIRWSLTIPNAKEVNYLSFINHVNKNKKNIIHFFELCSDANIVAHQDCNALPICMFDPEDIIKILHVKPDTFTKTHCEQAVIDVTPDLKVYRCFGMTDVESEISLLNFNTFGEIYEYYHNFDEKFRKIHLFSRCAECKTQERNGTSCGCLKYRNN